MRHARRSARCRRDQGTPFRWVAEESLIDFEHSMHVGIRGPLHSGLDLDESEKCDFAAVHARDFLRSPIDDLVNRVRDRLGDRPVWNRSRGGTNVYPTRR